MPIVGEVFSVVPLLDHVFYMDIIHLDAVRLLLTGLLLLRMFVFNMRVKVDLCNYFWTMFQYYKTRFEPLL